MKPVHDVIRNVITAAADRELLPRYQRIVHTHKADGSLLTEADTAVQDAIRDKLADYYPRISFLGEEMEPEEQAFLLASGNPVWCLDPLDGTRNYAAGIPFFSISLALLIEGEITHAYVYDPMRGEFFAAERNAGASLNNHPLKLPHTQVMLRDAVAIIDFKRLHSSLAQRLVTDTPYASQRSFGSVALDWCWLAAGRGDIYLHGKSHIWDYAAGNLIFHEAGGYSTTLEGEQIFVAKLQPRSALAATDQALFHTWQDWLAGN